MTNECHLILVFIYVKTIKTNQQNIILLNKKTNRLIDNKAINIIL